VSVAREVRAVEALAVYLLICVGFGYFAAKFGWLDE